MNSVMVLKTPQGALAGCIRLRQEDGMCVLTAQDCPREARIFCTDVSGALNELRLNAHGEARLTRAPAAVAVLDAQGYVRSMGGSAQEAGRLAAAAQQLIAREHMAETDEPLQEESVSAAAPAQEAEPPRTAEPLPAPRSAWPPPPFFPAAQFKDGAWQA